MTVEPLIQRLQQREPAAWSAFVNTWAPNLYTYLCYNIPTPQAVEGLITETFLSLLQSIDRYQGEVTLATFVYAVAYRKVADYWRRPPAVAELAGWLLPTDPIRMSTDLAEVFAELPEQAQQVLFLRYRIGLTLDEIAELLGRSRKATEVLLMRARNQLEEKISLPSTEELATFFRTQIPPQLPPAGLLARVEQQVLAHLP